MGKFHKPVKGSRAYWPRKRAARIYPQFNSYGFAGYKVGMTQVSYVDSRKGSPTSGREIFVPATVLAVPNLAVAGIKAYRKTGEGLKDSGVEWAGNLSKDLKRKASFPEKPKTVEFDKNSVFRLVVYTKPREALGKKKPEMFEIPVKDLETAKAKLGKDVSISDVFKEGDFVDVRSITKGKGTQGPVKRFGVKIRIRKATFKRRHVGTLGPRTPARIRPGTVAMAGQMGFQTRTEYNKKVLKIGEKLNPPGGWVNFGQVEGKFVLLSGSVPGPRKRLIFIRKASRPNSGEKSEAKQIVLEPQN